MELDFESETEPLSKTDTPDLPNLAIVNTSELNSLNSHHKINHISPFIYSIPIEIVIGKNKFSDCHYKNDDSAFLDTGAQRSLVKYSLFTKLRESTNKPNYPELLKTKIVLKSISGDKLRVYGKTTLKLYIKQLPFFCDFMVVEDSCCTFPGNILLGCDI